MRVVEAVDQVAHSVIVDGKEVSSSQMTERMGFTRERAWTRISEISGGERRRLQLMRLLMAEPNVLLLDEPTNDLDTDTLAAMEDLLDAFPGTLVVVSHDRYLLERVTDHQVALLGDGSLRALPGGVEEYLRIREAGGATFAADASTSGESAVRSRQSGNASGGESSDSTKNAGMTDSAARRAAKKEAARLERKIESLRARLEKVEAELALLAEKVATDPSVLDEMTSFSAQSTDLRAEIEELEEAWLENAELLDD